MDLHVMRSPESENHTFRVGSVWHVCVTVISITQKQITVETSNLIFYICITYRCYLRIFIKMGPKFCEQEHTKNSNTLRLTVKVSCY